MLAKAIAYLPMTLVTPKRSGFAFRLLFWGFRFFRSFHSTLLCYDMSQAILCFTTKDDFTEDFYKQTH